MNPAWIVGAVAVGIALGVIYFGGLWLTVRGVPTMRQPAFWFLVSFVLRMSVVLSGFYMVIGGRWERLVACMVGFLLARTLLIRHLRDVGQASSLPNA
ncbi:MAG: ATP synthase subunit I [Planctomycetota bacterium]|nr:MAG: ATP synthase subunit I [Planctomycetota bacterium]REJ96806.1 MAG: ATP synthase subunit I [Planctomycetota bacterium]REK23997.1 MAG: ATP synthase subunit I [Planctomycetota bacterium]REK39328.1 MAG: ATP synthase subunit I [Planctomycetota bacterium]